MVVKQKTLFTSENADFIITQLDHVYEFGHIIQVVHTVLYKMASNVILPNWIMYMSLGHIIQVVHTVLYEMASNVIKMPVYDTSYFWPILMQTAPGYAA